MPKLHDRLFGLVGFLFQIIIACMSFQATMFPGAAWHPWVAVAGLALHPLPWLRGLVAWWGGPKFH